MKSATREWLKKAEADYAGARRLAGLRRPPMGDLVCFHCQQCVEKLLKGRLQEADIAFPKIHNLESLLNLVLPIEPGWEPFRAALQHLTGYAVDFRYPGEAANAADARRALDETRKLRLVIRRSLGVRRQ